MSIVNLLFCYYVHGLDGNEKDLLSIKTKVENNFNLIFQNNNETKEIKNFYFGYCSKDNAYKKSHEEFDILVDNSFKELKSFLEDTLLIDFKKNNKEIFNNNENVECNLYFSIIGHSLGGLISRGVIKQIYSSIEIESIKYENYFEYLKSKFTYITDIKPCSFLTLSAPHFGILTGNETGGIFKTFENFAVRIYCNFLTGNIGKSFIYKDGKNGEKPSLIKLCQKEYMNILSKFPNRTLVGCIRKDFPVTLCSCIGDMEQPIDEYKKENLLIDDSKSDTRICSYSGYNEGQELDFYQKEIFNVNSSKNIFYNDTKFLTSLDVDKQIKERLINQNIKKDESSLKYEEMEDIFISDTINQTEASVATVKLFNQISYRRIIIDFYLNSDKRYSIHDPYIGNLNETELNNPELCTMASKTVSLFSNILLADFIWTSKQNSNYSLNSL